MTVGADGDIYVAWRDTIPIIDMEKRSIDYYGNAEVISTRSKDGGKSFGNTIVNITGRMEELFFTSLHSIQPCRILFS